MVDDQRHHYILWLAMSDAPLYIRSSMTHPPKDAQALMDTVIFVRLPRRLRTRIEQSAKRRRMKRSEWVRQAIALALMREGGL